MPLVLPNDVANGQPADGDKVQQNFSTIEDYVNQELIRRDGQVAMQAALLLPGPPTQANQAATKGYVDAAGPVGSVIMFAGDTEPTGYLFCRGQAVSRTTYAALFAVIAVRFGAGNGSSTFNLPNYQATVPVGHNTNTNPPAGLTGKFTAGVGERTGSTDTALIAHSHSLNYSHTHGLANHSHAVNIWSGNENQSHYHGAALGEFFQTTNNPGYWLDTFPYAADVGVGYAGTGYANVSHQHSVNGSTDGPSWNATDYGGGAINTAGAGSGGTANNNIQPSLTINFLIKV